MNLSHIVAHHADRRADETAFLYRGETATYGELKSRMERMAGVLAEAGVGRGDVVAVLLHNSIRFIDVMCATAHLGAVFMPLNWRLAGPELEYILNHAEAKALVSEEELKPLVEDLPNPPQATRLSIDGTSEGGWSSIAEMWDAASPVEEAAEVAGEDLHRLMYTSGTTSRPKA